MMIVVEQIVSTLKTIVLPFSEPKLWPPTCHMTVKIGTIKKSVVQNVPSRFLAKDGPMHGVSQVTPRSYANHLTRVRSCPWEEGNQRKKRASKSSIITFKLRMQCNKQITLSCTQRWETGGCPHPTVKRLQCTMCSRGTLFVLSRGFLGCRGRGYMCGGCICFPFFVSGLGNGWCLILTTSIIGLLISKGDDTHFNTQPAETWFSLCFPVYGEKCI